MLERKKPYILVVDDNPVNNEIITDFLGDAYEVHSVSDGQQCLNAIAERKPDLVLMDLMMPVLSGEEAVKRLKTSADTKNIPIVAVTAQAMKESFKELFSLGVSDYVTKPFSEHRLKQTIRGLLNEAEPLNKRELPALDDGNIAINIYQNSAVVNFYSKQTIPENSVRWLLAALHDNFVTPVDIVINRNADSEFAQDAFARVIDEASFGQYKNLIRRIAYIGEPQATHALLGKLKAGFLKHHQTGVFSKIADAAQWFAKAPEA